MLSVAHPAAWRDRVLLACHLGEVGLNPGPQLPVSRAVRCSSTLEEGE